MKRLLIGFSVLSLLTLAQAVNAEKNMSGVKDREQDRMLVWTTLDNRPYINTALKKIGVKRASVEVFDPVVNFKRFCTGLEAIHPDVVVTSRGMTLKELERCRDRGVSEVIRIKIGDEAIVFAAEKSSKPIPLTPQFQWRAFSYDVFEEEMESASPIISNPHKKWSDLDKSLPNQPIKLLAPAKDSAQYNSFKELGMAAGCRKYEWIKVMKYHRHFRTHYKALCYRARKDGAVIHTTEGDASMADRIASDKASIGMLSFSEWNKGDDRLQAMSVDGVMPTLASIKNGSYPLVRSHYVYIKKDNLDRVSGLQKLIDGIASDAAIGKSGYLTKMDLVQTGSPKQAKTMLEMPARKKNEKK